MTNENNVCSKIVSKWNLDGMEDRFLPLNKKKRKRKKKGIATFYLTILTVRIVSLYLAIASLYLVILNL